MRARAFVRFVPFFPFAPFACGLLAPALAAQAVPVYDYVTPPQPTPGAGFGSSVAVLDWDGDGHLDLAVGAPGESRVYLMLSDGHPTQPVFTFAPPALEPPAPQVGVDLFGGDLFAAELDGDAGGELLVGAPGRSVGGVNQCGAAWVFGLAGGALEVLPTTLEPALFGESVALADLDHDGLVDLAVAAPRAAVDGVPAGAVHVVYAPLGPASLRRVLHNPQGATQWGNYGHELAVDDLDGDGGADLVVSAIGNTSAGLPAAGEVYAHFGPLPRPGTPPLHLVRPALLLDAWPDPGDLPGPRYGMSVAARAGVVAVGANRKDWAGVKDAGVGFLFRDATSDEPPLRLLRPGAQPFDLLGIDGTLVDLLGDATPELVLSSLSAQQPMALLVWDVQSPGLPLVLAAPPGAGDHFANGLAAGQLVPGGPEELALGDGGWFDAASGAQVGRVAILLGIQ